MPPSPAGRAHAHPERDLLRRDGPRAPARHYFFLLFFLPFLSFFLLFFFAISNSLPCTRATEDCPTLTPTIGIQHEVAPHYDGKTLTYDGGKVRILSGIEVMSRGRGCGSASERMTGIEPA